MERTGYLRPLLHEPSDPVDYFADVGNEPLFLNERLGQSIRLSFMGEKACIHCGRKVKKTFNSGSCYPCFRKLPENDLCIVKPELCHFHQGTCRDNTFGETHCMQPHYIYLALSSGVKVGITRKTNALKRWMDQGAVAALPIAEVPTRKAAGELEVHLSQYVPDKTNWRRMLKNEIADRDLYEVKNELQHRIPAEFEPFLLKAPSIHRFAYPNPSPPEKMTSLNLDKQPEVSGRLLGIKGQYLILDSGVLNIRKYTGYKVEWAV
ncbi:DUF2797 domain-containing protein [Paludifilum halophilum]|uniref:DUF2797 domain-containing protein n=1 Tax=Paludifilum halophilum TaxID=1642702 RepID=A0A235B5J2_9BACL|nr:DUF2797 domain-containing protein [Paludifilum halophilum]OYD07568.1 hypothetical protein CHM34_11430 [Paludifilum halophilum]